MNQKKRAQSFLEVTIAFVLISIFVLGVVNLWVWSDVQIVGKQDKYNNSRLKAGQPTTGSTNYQDPMYPVYDKKILEEKSVIGDDIFG